MTMPATATAIALGVEMFAMSLVLGATVWFFLVQSPVLIKSMGRERFVPLQMRLAVVFFKTTTAALAVMMVATVLRTQAWLAWPTVTAAFALVAVAINQQVVLPRALRAGGRSRRIDDHQTAATTAGFVSDGAGLSTQTVHRLVVAFVVLMLVSVLAHGISLVTISIG